jgi:hypothetical protein
LGAAPSNQMTNQRTDQPFNKPTNQSGGLDES